MGSLEDLVCSDNEDDFAMTDSSHVPVLYQITAGLNQLHSLGIVHGNLKPSNILVSFPKGDLNDPMMKLADFAIRHAVRDETTGLKHFRLVTTEGWMCPSDTHDPIQPSSDVFSLACVFVFVASNGLHPLSGTDPIFGIASKQSMTSFFSASLLIPSFLDRIVKMLNFDSTKRPSVPGVLSHQIFDRLQSVILSSVQENGLQEQQSELSIEEPSNLIPSTPLSPDDAAADIPMQEQCLDDK